MVKHCQNACMSSQKQFAGVRGKWDPRLLQGSERGGEASSHERVIFLRVCFFFFFLYQEPQTLTAESFSAAAVLNQLISDLMFFPCKWTSSSQLKRLLSLRCFSCLTSNQLKEKVEKETHRESTLGRLAHSRQDN